MSRPFKRIHEGAWLGGVCGGLAYAWGWPTWVIRFLWLVAVLGLGFGGLIYVLLWLLVPRWAQTPSDYAQVTEEAS